jgi:hypothetical protein
MLVYLQNPVRDDAFDLLMMKKNLREYFKYPGLDRYKSTPIV